MYISRRTQDLRGEGTNPKRDRANLLFFGHFPPTTELM